MGFLIADTPQELADIVAAGFAREVDQVLKHRGRCTVVLSGGTTPKLFLSRLAEEPYRSSVSWDRLHFFWGDERCVPYEHPESNSRMAQDALLKWVHVSAANIYRMPADQGHPNEAAAIYEETLRKFFGITDSNFPQFDIVFLGMGSDGHAASLFPGSPALAEKIQWVVPSSRGSEQMQRLTMTIPVFNNARKVLFVVQGAEKSATLKKVLAESQTSDLLPAQMIQPQRGSKLWFLDRMAAGTLQGVADEK